MSLDWGVDLNHGIVFFLGEDFPGLYSLDGESVDLEVVEVTDDVVCKALADLSVESLMILDLRQDNIDGLQ